jgi:hypothetical protein
MSEKESGIQSVPGTQGTTQAQTVWDMIAALAGHLHGRGGQIRIGGGKWKVTAPRGVDIRDFYAEVMSGPTPVRTKAEGR